MAISKIIYKSSAEDTGTVWMDTTDKTVAADKMVSGITALKNDGTTVTGNLTSRSSSDLTASGATVTVPAGVYSSQASKAVSSGSATTPATTVTANPSISVSSGGLITATASATQSVTPTVSAGYVSSGTAGTITVSGSNTNQLTTQAAQTIHPSATAQTIASGKYLTGTQTISAVTLTNLIAGNIKKDVVVKVGDADDDDCVASITGTYEGGGGGQTTWETLYNDSVTVVDYGESVYYVALTDYYPSHDDFVTGETYRVTWNGVQYTCQPFVCDTPDYGGTGLCIGNSVLYGGAVGNNEPFYGQRMWSTYLMFCTTTPLNTTFTLKIEKEVSGGSSGLEYETGTWTPATDVARGEISFSNTHTEAPILIMLSDTTNTYSDTTNTNYSFIYGDWYKAFSSILKPSTSVNNYGAWVARYRSTNTTSMTFNYSAFTYSSDDTGSTTSYPRYFATESKFYPYTNADSRYWKSGRTYKWIAVWKPST